MKFSKPTPENVPVAAHDKVLEQEAKIEALEAEVLRIAEQQEAAAPSAPVALPFAPATPFRVGDTEYRFTIQRFFLDGGVTSAQEALSDEALLARIVAEYPRLIEQVES